MRAWWRGVPRAGRACAAVALVFGVSWSLLIPPFHVPDEISHVGYVQYFAQTGKLPKIGNVSQYSPEEQRTLAALTFSGVIGNPNNRPPMTEAQTRQLKHIHADRVGLGDASTATGNPPTYYALEAIPYWVSPSHNLLDRLVLMRLVNAVLAALTVLFVFEFLRTLLPATPWAWPVGALAVALQPTFGFISGGVNNDNLAFMFAALIFWLLARSFRDGLSVRLGIALGLASAGGVLSKLTILGLIPAVGLALLIHALRSRNLRPALVAVASGAVPLLVYLFVARVFWHRGLTTPGQISGTVGTSAHGTPREAISYVWQLFLPRLPFMLDQVPGFGLHDIWFHGFIGQFGWVDYGFPGWVYDLAWVIAIGVALLALAGLARSWRNLRLRLPELAVYVVAVAGQATLVGLVDYQSRISNAALFEQARYLLPLLALYGALVAVAARAGGRRFGPALGAALVMLALAHTVFAQLLTLTRYYG
jgi:hypothetical protein